MLEQFNSSFLSSGSPSIEIYLHRRNKSDSQSFRGDQIQSACSFPSGGTGNNHDLPPLMMSHLTRVYNVKIARELLLGLFEVAFFVDLAYQCKCGIRQLGFTVFSTQFRLYLRMIFEALPFVLYWYNDWAKIIRILRLKDVFERLENMIDHFFIGFLKPLFMHVYYIHVVACILHYVATTSEGYGDIHAVKLREMIVIIFLHIFSLVILGYLGVTFTNLFSRTSKAKVVEEMLDREQTYVKFLFQEDDRRIDDVERQG
ncbi:unnamed protein product [Cochlearia groenlandica]